VRTVPVIVDSCLRVERDLAVAWAAGFLDGEGSFQGYYITPAWRSPYFIVAVTATQVGNREPIDRLQKLFGGHVNTSNRAGIRRPCYQWTLRRGNEVVKILEELLPHLICKQDQAAVLLQYVRTFRTAGGRHRTLPLTVLRRHRMLRELQKIRYA
jgi:hypothetical protein